MGQHLQAAVIPKPRRNLQRKLWHLKRSLPRKQLKVLIRTTRERKPHYHPFTLLPTETGFVGNRNLVLEDQIDYFRQFLTPVQSAAIVANTNDFGQNSDKAWDSWVNIDQYDLDHYIGLSIYMGICVLPSIEDY